MPETPFWASPRLQKGIRGSSSDRTSVPAEPETVEADLDAAILMMELIPRIAAALQRHKGKKVYGYDGTQKHATACTQLRNTKEITIIRA